MLVSYLTPKAEVRSATSGRPTAHATTRIRAGETVAVFGGLVATRAEVEGLDDETRALAIQVDDDLFLVSPEPTAGDALRHSCAPNCGMSGASMIVAMRDVEPGEELVYDHAMSDGSPYDEFECHCGAATCRAKVTGEDWMLPELQLRYRGYFSPYLAARINALAGAGTGATRRAFAY